MNMRLFQKNRISLENFLLISLLSCFKLGYLKHTIYEKKEMKKIK